MKGDASISRHHLPCFSHQRDAQVASQHCPYPPSWQRHYTKAKSNFKTLLTITAILIMVFHRFRKFVTPEIRLAEIIIYRYFNHSQAKLRIAVTIRSKKIEFNKRIDIFSFPNRIEHVA